MNRVCASLALLAMFVAGSACVKGSSTQQPPATTASDPEDGNQTSTDGEPDAAEGVSEPTDASVPGPTLPEGPTCDSDADCAAEEICEGMGCGAGEGRCAPRERICTRDLALYCGCDGAEFQGSGSCPGKRYAYRGPCEPALENGEPCTDGRQCRSGQCVGDGLEGCSSAAGGVCGEVACTQDLMTYCGCNGVEFQTSGSCPNREFAYRGPCEASASP